MMQRAFNACKTESCTHRSGFSETRSHPTLKILLKRQPKTLETRMNGVLQHVYALHEQQCTICPSSGKTRITQIFLLKCKR